jgi:hypothetical protein
LNLVLIKLKEISFSSSLAATQHTTSKVVAALLSWMLITAWLSFCAIAKRKKSKAVSVMAASFQWVDKVLGIEAFPAY